MSQSGASGARAGSSVEKGGAPWDNELECPGPADWRANSRLELAVVLSGMPTLLAQLGVYWK